MNVRKRQLPNNDRKEEVAQMSQYHPEGMLIDTYDNQNSMKSIAALHEAAAQAKILEAKLGLLSATAHTILLLI